MTRMDPDDLAELRLDQVLERRYLATLARNPDCRDPAHPGCEHCVDRDDDEQEKTAS